MKPRLAREQNERREEREKTRKRRRRRMYNTLQELMAHRGKMG